MIKTGIKPTTVQGPGNPGGYLTKGEYQAKLDEIEGSQRLYPTT